MRRRHDICPWWFGYILASPLRKLRYQPRAILEPFVHEGMTVYEPGPGMGFFTIELARLVGKNGRVIAVDIQKKMIEGLHRRATRAGYADRIELRLAGAGGMGIDDLSGCVDFILAFAMVHELHDARQFFMDAHLALKSGGRLLYSEPSNHVREAEFRLSLDLAQESGLRLEGISDIRHDHTAVLLKD